MSVLWENPSYTAEALAHRRAFQTKLCELRKQISVWLDIEDACTPDAEGDVSMNVNAS